MVEEEMDDAMPTEEVKLDYALELSNKLFALKAKGTDPDLLAGLKDDVLQNLFDRDASALYSKYCEEFGWMLDDSKLASMKTKNEEELKKLEERIVDAQENLGDNEVRESLLAKAEFFARIGEKEKALEAFKVTEAKTTAVGHKIDMLFFRIRMFMAEDDTVTVKSDLAKVKKLFEEGGDWERKNRLKVYEGVFLMATRDLKGAAKLFLDSIATFTTTELFSYDTFIFYTVVTCIVSLDRVTLKQKVVDAPEILTVIEEVPYLKQFLESLYNCEYKSFFQAFVEISDMVNADRYLHRHYRYFLRSIRVVAYSQFLDAYKSVTLASMAAAFGVSPEFLDTELSSFISAGRLNCKIDKVAGIVETNRPDAKNTLYQKTIKQGDLLLTRIQKLSKVVDY